MVTLGLEARAANMGEFAVGHGTTLGGAGFPTNWPATRRVILCLRVDTVLTAACGFGVRPSHRKTCMR